MKITMKKVLVPTDFSETADLALFYGVSVAEQYGAQLHLLHVIADLGTIVGTTGEFTAVPVDVFAAIEKEQAAALEQLPRGAAREKLDVVRAIRHGTPYLEICKYAEQEKVDLVVMGTHGRTGLKHLLIGSVAERVVRASDIPVLTVRHSGAKD